MHVGLFAEKLYTSYFTDKFTCGYQTLRDHSLAGFYFCRTFNVYLASVPAELLVRREHVGPPCDPPQFRSSGHSVLYNATKFSLCSQAFMPLKN